MSPMSEDDASLKKEKQRSTGSGGRKSKKDKDQAVKRSKAKEEKQKREEVKEDKPDLSQMPSFKGEVGRRERGAVKARAGSLSEDGASSDPGLAEPNCQPEHMPHPSPAQLRDKKYFARLQVRTGCYGKIYRIFYNLFFVGPPYCAQQPSDLRHDYGRCGGGGS